MASNSCSVLSLNCEGHKHLDKILPFLRAQNAEVMCLQEVFLQDVPAFENALDLKVHFVPTMEITKPNRYGLDPLGVFGLVFLSRLPMSNFHTEYYVGTKENIPMFIDGKPNSNNRVLIWATVQKGEDSFTFATTHFTWSDNGETSPEQLHDFQKLQKLLEKIPEFVLCGDFNSVRGKEIFSELSSKYTDNIPSEVISTLDPNLHRAKKSFVVDGLFSTSHYRVHNIQIICGVSDHCAVKGSVYKE